MRQYQATIFGFFVASVVPAAYFAVVHPLSGERDPQSLIGTFLVAYFFSLSSTLILGAPLYLLLRRWSCVRWWTASASGALAGLVVLLVIRFSSELEFATAVRFALLGGASGLLFWVCWRTGRSI